MTEMTRRKFIINTSIACTGATFGVPLLSSCATTGEDSSPAIDNRPTHYPRLQGHKIQSPEHYDLEGCMTGCWFGLSANQSISGWTELTEKAPNIVFLPYRDSNLTKGEYFTLTPEIKKVLAMQTITDEMIVSAERGVIPFVTYDMRYDISSKPNRKNCARDQVIAGKHDKAIVAAAKSFREYGEKYGGFFIRTMREMNLGDTWPWAGNSNKFKKAWIHIWDIFESEGANEYATWMWNPYVGTQKDTRTADRYYPDDKYVDWIGLNGYNFDGQSWTSAKRQSFSNLFYPAYSKMRKKHPSKPIMIAETGMDDLPYKPKWVLDAFETTKTKMPGVKALGWWHDNWSSGGVRNFDSKIDSSLEVLEAFKKGISDPYFLEKVPYKTNKS